MHREGVPYSNAAVANRYRRCRTSKSATRGAAGQAQIRGANTQAGTERMGIGTVTKSAPAASRNVSAASRWRGQRGMHSDNGYSSLGPSRSNGGGFGGGGHVGGGMLVVAAIRGGRH